MNSRAVTDALQGVLDELNMRTPCWREIERRCEAALSGAEDSKHAEAVARLAVHSGKRERQALLIATMRVLLMIERENDDASRD